MPFPLWVQVIIYTYIHFIKDCFLLFFFLPCLLLFPFKLNGKSSCSLVEKLLEAGCPRPLFVMLSGFPSNILPLYGHVQLHRQMDDCGSSLTSYRGRFFILVATWTYILSQHLEALPQRVRKKG